MKSLLYPLLFVCAATSCICQSAKFAEPFSRAKLQQAQLDIIRDEARKLDAELHDKDASAQAIIAKYRESAKTAAASGASLPPVPAALRRPFARRPPAAVGDGTHQPLRIIQATAGPDARADQ